MRLIVEIKNIVKKYGSVTAVDDVSLDIRKGEFFSLLGPSGCGKTTILRIIGGFIGQNSGTVLIDGINMDGVAPNKRNTSMVFQNLALFPHMNVKENIVYGLKKRRISENLIKDRLKNILSAVNLAGYEKRGIHELSGGQQQRVALARSLIIEPDILLLDEPLASLDKKLRVSMRSELKEIQRRTGATFLYVTHDQSEAITMSDNMGVMNHGKIIQTGQPDVVYNRPANSFVADFIGAGNFISLHSTETAGSSHILTAAKGGRIMLEKNIPGNLLGTPNTCNDKIKNLLAQKDAKDIESLSSLDSCSHPGNMGTNIISDAVLDAALVKKPPFFFIRPEKINVRLCKDPCCIQFGDLINRFTGNVKSVVFEGPDIRIKIYSEQIGFITSEIKSLEPGLRFSENDPVEFYWEPREGLILYA